MFLKPRICTQNDSHDYPEARMVFTKDYCSFGEKVFLKSSFYTGNTNRMTAKMDPEKQKEMHELALKLDKDIDDYLDELAAKKAKENKPKKEFDFEECMKEIDNHPAFMKKLPEGKEGELPAAIEALQALKYDEEDPPEERALQFKEDGNKQFKYKRYRTATECYTEGIKVRCSDLELNAVLYANRAAANFHLKNYRSALKDCILARKFKPDHAKAISRGIDCMIKLNLPTEALEWISECETSFAEVDKWAEKREEVEKMLKLKQRDTRKAATSIKKDLQEKMKLLIAFKKRNYNFRDILKLDYSDPESFEWEDIEISMPQLSNPVRVKLAEDGNLVWPVIFLYPESNQSDFVQEFFEEVTFKDQLEVVLENAPEWDSKAAYSKDTVEVYFESYKKPDHLCRISLNWKLGQVLSSPHYSIPTALPAFIVLARNTPFRDEYLSKYSVIDLAQS